VAHAAEPQPVRIVGLGKHRVGERREALDARGDAVLDAPAVRGGRGRTGRRSGAGRRGDTGGLAEGLQIRDEILHLVLVDQRRRHSALGPADAQKRGKLGAVRRRDALDDRRAERPALTVRPVALRATAVEAVAAAGRLLPVRRERSAQRGPYRNAYAPPPLASVHGHLRAISARPRPTPTSASSAAWAAGESARTARSRRR